MRPVGSGELSSLDLGLLSIRERDALQAIFELGEAAVGEVGRQIGVHVSTTNDILTALAEKGLVEKTRSRKRRLTSAGANLLKDDDRQIESDGFF